MTTTQDARRRGTFERVLARRLWVGSCVMVAITSRGSAFHRAAGELRGEGDLAASRKAELDTVLGAVGLGWLCQSFAEAQEAIRTLASLRRLSVDEVMSKLTGPCGQQAATMAVRLKLQSLGVKHTSGDAPMAAATVHVAPVNKYYIHIPLDHTSQNRFQRITTTAGSGWVLLCSARAAEVCACGWVSRRPNLDT